MKIVIDTNLVISAMFFGGKPRKLVNLLRAGKFNAYASEDIVTEYNESADDFASKYHKPIQMPLSDIVEKLHQIEVTTEVHVCRDPDDDKFIGCALDSKSKYIVSGDKDLLSLKP